MSFIGNAIAPVNPTVKRLLKLVKRDTSGQGDEKDNKWEERAVKSLAKKLKKGTMLDELEKAIAQEDSQSICVKIPRFVRRFYSFIVDSDD